MIENPKIGQVYDLPKMPCFGIIKDKHLIYKCHQIKITEVNKDFCFGDYIRGSLQKRCLINKDALDYVDESRLCGKTSLKNLTQKEISFAKLVDPETLMLPPGYSSLWKITKF